MRPAQLLEYIRSLVLEFYRFILKLSINAHQVIAYWRIRINREQSDIRTSKTPNSRIKLSSILRRLSIRNFMEYCVIALNEASSSSCSNKFDLSSCDRPVWLLGKQYHLPEDAEKLLDDIRSKLWMTYRRNFPPIDGYTTDRGFGCMIRCGQMVLANALLHKNLGRDWHWSPDGLDSNPGVYRKVLKLFQDKEDCPYSIHNIVRTGQQEGKVIGEWFGPNTIAQALKRMASTSNSISNEVTISIDAALDNVVVMDEIRYKFKNRGSYNITGTNNGQEGNYNPSKERFQPIHDKWIPGILFIQLRLGLTKINPLYFAALKKTFQFMNSLGIIGGRPNHALYLIGYTDDDIIYLDPHSTQQYTGEIDDGTYHCANPEKMPIDRLDPSLALCFYFHTEHEFNEWCTLSNDLLIESEQTPMFEITESRPSDWGKYESYPVTRPNKEKFTILKESDGDCLVENLELKTKEKSASDNSQTNDEEEFEMLG